MPPNVAGDALSQVSNHRSLVAASRQNGISAHCLGRFTPGMAFLLMCIVTGLGSNCEGQDSPAVKVYAYERDIVGGIPDGPPGVGAPARQIRYFIYLETPPEAQFAVEGVWMGGKHYEVETTVKKAPVRFESPVTLAQQEGNIAVPATPNKITEIVVKDLVPGKTPDDNVSTILRQSQAAVQLSYLGKSVLVPVDRFEKRDPIYMQ
jgi:hypothetical protein